jgi:hypothetical protein
MPSVVEASPNYNFEIFFPYIILKFNVHCRADIVMCLPQKTTETHNIPKDLHD